MTNFNFSSKFKYANILSLILFTLSVILIFFKGLNYGIDFKGGTLIELRSNNIESYINQRYSQKYELGRCQCQKIW